jgi:hypothetical protein
MLNFTFYNFIETLLVDKIKLVVIAGRSQINLTSSLSGNLFSLINFMFIIS